MCCLLFLSGYLFGRLMRHLLVARDAVQAPYELTLALSVQDCPNKPCYLCKKSGSPQAPLRQHHCGMSVSGSTVSAGRLCLGV